MAKRKATNTTRITSKTSSKKVIDRKEKLAVKSASKQTNPVKNISNRLWSKTLAPLVRRSKAVSARRSHKTLKLTHREDYVQTMPMPGYIRMTVSVFSTLTRHKKTFLLMLLFYVVILLLIGAITSQDIFVQVRDSLKSATDDFFGQGFGQVEQAGLLALSAFTGLPSTMTPDQKVYFALALLFTWLTTVWLLREFLLSRKPKLRDGLYNAGAPIFSTLATIGVILLQFIPAGLAILLYVIMSTTGWIDTGFGAMLFWIIAGLVGVMSLYWITSTILALVIVTLPGMYPMKAVKLAGDVIQGRRIRVLYRLLWGLLILALIWIFVMVPIILLVSWLSTVWEGLADWPIVPFFGVVMMAGSVIWYASYVYLFYRNLVEAKN